LPIPLFHNEPIVKGPNKIANRVTQFLLAAASYFQA
jgi:hypothetical protein